jgi:hypothetical protein
MRNTILVPLLLLLFFGSCKQSKVESRKALKFYDDVNAQILLNRAVQQNFIDQLTSAILAIKENKDTILDNKELLILLKDCESKNIIREKNIELLTEVDNSIDLKKYTLNYVRTFNDAYQNEFPKVIRIMAENTEDRFERAKELLFPQLQLIKERETEMINAQNIFHSKYETVSITKPERTGSDYAFVKLKDFKFTAATLNEGATIELLSFSGGDDLAEDKIYYKQFIGINKSTGDTLRILALAGMQQYDLDKAPRIGTYSTDLPIRNQMVPGDNEYIIFNTNQADIEQGNYQTVFGILKFEE